jgi:hypothetical protein
MGAPSLGSVTVPVEALVGAGGGLLGGLILGKSVGDLLKVSTSMATTILAAMAIAVPLVVTKLPRDTKNILYGLGVGFGAATVLRVIQPMFAAPAAAP